MKGKLGKVCEVDIEIMATDRHEGEEPSTARIGIVMETRPQWRSSTHIMGRTYSYLHTAPSKKAAKHQAAELLMKEVLPGAHALSGRPSAVAYASISLPWRKIAQLLLNIPHISRVSWSIVMTVIVSLRCRRCNFVVYLENWSCMHIPSPRDMCRPSSHYYTQEDNPPWTARYVWHFFVFLQQIYMGNTWRARQLDY